MTGRGLDGARTPYASQLARRVVGCDLMLPHGVAHAFPTCAQPRAPTGSDISGPGSRLPHIARTQYWWRMQPVDTSASASCGRLPLALAACIGTHLPVPAQARSRTSLARTARNGSEHGPPTHLRTRGTGSARISSGHEAELGPASGWLGPSGEETRTFPHRAPSLHGRCKRSRVCGPRCGR